MLKKLLIVLDSLVLSKPIDAGSSFGVTKVHQIEDLQSAIDIAFEHDNELIIESFLDGTEVSVGCFRYKGEGDSFAHHRNCFRK